MNELLKRLQSELSQQAPEGLPAKQTVDLFLGNDREIGRERRSQEKRVGITPSHVKELRDFLSALGLGLNVFVMQGAGQRAGFSDSAFIDAGCEIMTEAELEDHDRAPDVFHALKEPSNYENRLPMPFCRIGAVHGGNFHGASGLANLLAKKNVVIFDGSNIGAPDAYRIPIRGRMSVFAGEIAAEWISDHLRAQQLRGRVVVVGGGRAGLSAARALSADAFVSEVHLFESKTTPDRVDAVRKAVADLENVSVMGLEGRDDQNLLSSIDQECVAVLFAVAVPGGKAPRVVHISHLETLHKKAIVVDISIDEKGAIFDPSISPDWEASRIIEHLEPRLKEKGIVYRAQENMPRSRAKEASEAHGDVILPYIATLLYLAAWRGGAEGVRAFIASKPTNMTCADPKNAAAGELLDALVQDLRNGLAFYSGLDRIVVEEVVPDRVNILSFLLEKEIPFEFKLPLRESLKKEKLKETESALDLFPEDVREFLQFAFEQGITGSVISHPEQDGTTTRGAAAALRVPPANVLKTLIWKQGNDLIAVICSGAKHVDETLLRTVTDAEAIRLGRPDEVMSATGHVPGAVPTIGLFKMKESIKTVYLSEEVLALDYVCGSAGSVFIGFRFHPQKLVELGAVVAALTPPNSLLRKSESRVRKIWSEIERAIDRDEDDEGAKAVRKLQAILEETTPAPFAKKS
jgi:alanine dehydrogenase